MTKRLCFIFGLAIIAMRSGVPFGHAAENMKIRADVWMPVNGDPSAAQPGYAVEVLRAIFPPQGIEVDYQTMPWAEALKAAANCEIGGVIGASKIEAAKLVVPSETIAISRVGLFALKGQRLNMADFRIVYTHEGDDVFIAFAPNAAGRKFAKLLDEGLQRLRMSGELARILRTYGLDDWK